MMESTYEPSVAGSMTNRRIKKWCLLLLILSGLNILRHTAWDFYVFALRPTS